MNDLHQSSLGRTMGSSFNKISLHQERQWRFLRFLSDVETIKQIARHHGNSLKTEKTQTETLINA